MLRFSLRSLFVLIGLCAVASRLGSEVLAHRAHEAALAALQATDPTIRSAGKMSIFL